MGVTALSTLTVRPAGPEEFDLVLELLAESIRWLRGRGLDQWSTWPNWRDKMRPALGRGDVWLLVDDGDPIGTITVEYAGDADFWTSAEMADSAAYVSKLAVRRDHAGAELGALLLAWVGDLAYRRGCSWVRLDAWKTNEHLHQYYADRGWSYLRTSPLEHRHSGALFQRPAEQLPASERGRLLELPAPTKLPSENSGRPEPDPAGNWQPHHWHQVGGLVVEHEWTGEHPPRFMPGLRYRLLRHADGRWHLEDEPQLGRWRPIGPVTVAPAWLTEGTVHVITHRDSQPCELMITEAPGVPT